MTVVVPCIPLLINDYSSNSGHTCGPLTYHYAVARWLKIATTNGRGQYVFVHFIFLFSTLIRLSKYTAPTINTMEAHVSEQGDGL